MGDRCACHCHHYSGIENPESVDVADPLEAIMACPSCVNLHCPALLSRRLANDLEPAQPVEEKSAWVDPPPQADGDGN